MTYQRERDLFIARATSEGLTLPTITRLLRHATTLQRLAEVQCNGDWPYNDGRDGYLHGTASDPNGHAWQERHYAVCPSCESSCAKSAMRRSSDQLSAKSKHDPVKVCPDCRTSELVRALLCSPCLQPGFKGMHSLRAIINGDPRGAVLKLATPNYPYSESGANGANGLYVPTRS